LFAQPFAIQKGSTSRRDIVVPVEQRVVDAESKARTLTSSG
jgi:hypothetical protein